MKEKLNGHVASSHERTYIVASISYKYKCLIRDTCDDSLSGDDGDESNGVPRDINTGEAVYILDCIYFILLKRTYVIHTNKIHVSFIYFKMQWPM
jgi:hypothetical protein